MKKVYLVCENNREYGYDLPVQVFSTKEQAEKFAKFANNLSGYGEFNVVEIPLDLEEDKWLITKVYIFDDEIFSVDQRVRRYYDAFEPVEYEECSFMGKPMFIVYVPEQDIEKAKKIALELFKSK